MKGRKKRTENRDEIENKNDHCNYQFIILKEFNSLSEKEHLFKDTATAPQTKVSFQFYVCRKGMQQSSLGGNIKHIKVLITLFLFIKCQVWSTNTDFCD